MRVTSNEQDANQSTTSVSGKQDQPATAFLNSGDAVLVRYKDHLRFNHPHPEVLMPVIREALGWLVYACGDYVIVSLDRNAAPPTLKGGDPNVLGHVLLRSDILELRKLRVE